MALQIWHSAIQEMMIFNIYSVTDVHTMFSISFSSKCEVLRTTNLKHYLLCPLLCTDHKCLLHHRKRRVSLCRLCGWNCSSVQCFLLELCRNTSTAPLFGRQRIGWYWPKVRQEENWKLCFIKNNWTRQLYAYSARPQSITTNYTSFHLFQTVFFLSGGYGLWLASYHGFESCCRLHVSTFGDSLYSHLPLHSGVQLVAGLGQDQRRSQPVLFYRVWYRLLKIQLFTFSSP